MPKAAWTARRRVCSNDTHLPAAADGPAPSGRRSPHQELSALVRRRLLCSGPTPAGRLWDGSRAAFPRTPKVRLHGAPRRVSRPVGGAAGDGPPSSGSGGRHTGLPAGLPGFRQGRASRDAAPIRCALQPPGAGSGRPARPAAGGRSGRWPDGPSGVVAGSLKHPALLLQRGGQADQQVLADDVRLPAVLDPGAHPLDQDGAAGDQGPDGRRVGDPAWREGGQAAPSMAARSASWSA